MFFHWPQPTCIFGNGSLSIKCYSYSQQTRPTTCLASVCSHTILSGQNSVALPGWRCPLSNIPEKHHRFCHPSFVWQQSLNVWWTCCHSQPSAHRKVSHQLATLGKDTSLCYSYGSIHHITSSSPLQLTMLLPNFYSQHSGSILQLL